MPGRFYLNPDMPSERDVPAVAVGVPLELGDVVSVRTPGGGGYGDPLDRDPSRVVEDLLNERISPEIAEEVYGVKTRDGKLDAATTKRLRRKLRLKRIRSL